jgi:hypothetical protein
MLVCDVPQTAVVQLVQRSLSTDSGLQHGDVAVRPPLVVATREHLEVAMKYTQFSVHASRSFLFTLASLAAAACGAAEANGDDALSSSEVAEQNDTPFFETVEQDLFVAPTACEHYEAENIGRTGGSPTAAGWKLTSAGDNINVNRQFVSGHHSFSIWARGTAGGGTKPQMKLTLNGVQIGGNITVTNTGITDGWSQYVVNYNVATGNNKLIKVELANPGNGRALLIDGLHVFCPKSGVVCSDDPSCESCCYDQLDQQGYCGLPFCSNPIGISYTCDQPSDCGGGSICAAKGNNNGFGVHCIAPVDCQNSSQPIVLCSEICKSPTMPEWGCTQGGTCTDMGSTMPGWKQCVD